MSEPVIQVEGLSKRYSRGTASVSRYKTLRETLLEKLRPRPRQTDFWALEDISFQVRAGEIFGVIGRNGAGKTTLLKILSGITTPTRGGARIRGRLGSLLEVGTGFHPELTGRENIFLNGTLIGMKKRVIQNKFDEIVAFAEIDDFIDTPVKRYSSGMYVRLAFAVAAHLESEILLIDEVLAVGDAAFQKKCLGKMGEVAGAGKTILLVSHNMASIVNLCGRAILLDAGRVVKEGAPAEIVQSYLFGKGSGEGKVSWRDADRAPGNEWVRLAGACILQDGLGEGLADVDISKDVRVRIEYRNLREGTPLYSAIWLKDQTGTVVFSSGNRRHVSLTEDDWSGRPHPVGVFQSHCRIPGNFLNEGTYSVTVCVGKNVCDTQIFEENLLSFHVHDTGPMRREYYGPWVGVIRPRLEWQTRYLGNHGRN